VFPDLKNFPLKAISFRQNLLPALPSVPRPPPEFSTERHHPRWCAPARRMLEFISLMAITIFEEPPIEMIVYARILVAGTHDPLPPYVRGVTAQTGRLGFTRQNTTLAGSGSATGLHHRSIYVI